MTAKNQPFLVGRNSEVEQFAQLTKGSVNHSLLNIYGPGGIGKTIVGQKMQDFAAKNALPIAFIDGIRNDLTPSKMLDDIQNGLAVNQTLEDAFSYFERQYRNYVAIQEVMERGGGIQTMYSVIGNLVDPESLTHILGSLGISVEEHVKNVVSNRFTLERYLRGIEGELTSSLSDALSTAVASTGQPLSILIDTYEDMEGYDDWVCRHLVPALPDGVKLIILGRNALPTINFDWGELAGNLHAMELTELSEIDAKAYLQHYDLRNRAALNQVYQFTGGYPLLLVLVVHLARRAGGWENLEHMEHDGDKDHVATKLLERILREERVEEVQTFLEKGVVARWFTPETVSLILEIDSMDGRRIYDKLARHSFVQRHPDGLKFHDKIRELLLLRLERSNKSEFDLISERLTQYYAEKAGITEEKEVSAVERNNTSPVSRKKKKSFGELLRHYRHRASDPDSGKTLAQTRLAEFLEKACGLRYSGTTISNWETGKGRINIDNRIVLVGLAQVLHECGGITDKAEANALLYAAGHSHLSDDERRHIFGNNLLS